MDVAHLLDRTTGGANTLDPGMSAMLCLPGTMCSPEIFGSVEAPHGLDVQLLPVSWMTSPGPWDIETLGGRIAALIRDLGAGPAYIAGHSTGGTISLATAIKEPSLVNGLLLSNTGANMKGHGDAASIIRAIGEEWGADLQARVLNRCFHREPDPVLMRALLSYAAGLRKECALEALESQYALDLEPELGRITAPTVVAHGVHDRARPMAHAELLAAGIPRAELIPLDTGHTPMAEDPPGYSAALGRLLAMAGDP